MLVMNDRTTNDLPETVTLKICGVEGHYIREDITSEASAHWVKSEILDKLEGIKDLINTVESTVNTTSYLILLDVVKTIVVLCPVPPYSKIAME